MRKLFLVLATGFGLGYSPVASGTTGSLPGVLIALAIAPLGGVWQAFVCAVLAVLAIPICDAAEHHFGRKDDGRVVADEYLTFALCLVGIPWTAHPWFLAVAFVVCRIMDILKPPPARQAQNLSGGLGIVADDVASSLYALLINHVLWRFFVV